MQCCIPGHDRVPAAIVRRNARQIGFENRGKSRNLRQMRMKPKNPYILGLHCLLPHDIEPEDSVSYLLRSGKGEEECQEQAGRQFDPHDRCAQRDSGRSGSRFLNGIVTGGSPVIRGRRSARQGGGEGLRGSAGLGPPKFLFGSGRFFRPCRDCCSGCV